MNWLELRFLRARVSRSRNLLMKLTQVASASICCCFCFSAVISELADELVLSLPGSCFLVLLLELFVDISWDANDWSIFGLKLNASGCNQLSLRKSTLICLIFIIKAEGPINWLINLLLITSLFRQAYIFATLTRRSRNLIEFMQCVRKATLLAFFLDYLQVDLKLSIHSSSSRHDRINSNQSASYAFDQFLGCLLNSGDDCALGLVM